MTDSIIMITGTVCVLLLMAAAFLFIYFRSLRNDLQAQWRIVLDNLRLRLDKIPNLIENVRRFAPSATNAATELIKLRSACWPLFNPDKEKVFKELAVSLKLKEIWALENKYPALSHDTNYLALKMEFRDVNGEIEKSLEEYNNRLRKYNSKVRFFLFLPFALIFGFTKLPIFEFEP